MEIISSKLGSTVGNEWYSFPSKLLDVQHPVISGEIGGRLAAVPWLLPSVTASRISVSRRFLRRTHQLGILCWETPVDRYVMFLSSFLRRKPLLDIVSQKLISCDLCTSFACAKWRRPLGGSSWKLLEFTSVSRFLAYVTILDTCWLEEDIMSLKLLLYNEADMLHFVKMKSG